MYKCYIHKIKQVTTKGLLSASTGTRNANHELQISKTGLPDDPWLRYLANKNKFQQLHVLN